MACWITPRWGGTEDDPTEARMQEVLAELDVEDDEHPDAWLTHESGWTLSAFGSKLLIWENTNDAIAGQSHPYHLNNVSRERVLELWLKLAQGKIEEIALENWLQGYYDRR